MSLNQPVSEDDQPRRPRRIESFTVLFMVALGWTCTSSNGGSGSSGDDENRPTTIFGHELSGKTVVDQAPADDE
jgi:hypothetical protein